MAVFLQLFYCDMVIIVGKGYCGRLIIKIRNNFYVNFAFVIKVGCSISSFTTGDSISSTFWFFCSWKRVNFVSDSINECSFLFIPFFYFLFIVFAKSIEILDPQVI